MEQRADKDIFNNPEQVIEHTQPPIVFDDDDPIAQDGTMLSDNKRPELESAKSDQTDVPEVVIVATPAGESAADESAPEQMMRDAQQRAMLNEQIRSLPLDDGSTADTLTAEEIKEAEAIVIPDETETLIVSQSDDPNAPVVLAVPLDDEKPQSEEQSAEAVIVPPANNEQNADAVITPPANNEKQSEEAIITPPADSEQNADAVITPPANNEQQSEEAIITPPADIELKADAVITPPANNEQQGTETDIVPPESSTENKPKIEDNNDLRNQIRMMQELIMRQTEEQQRTRPQEDKMRAEELIERQNRLNAEREAQLREQQERLNAEREANIRAQQERLNAERLQFTAPPPPVYAQPAYTQAPPQDDGAMRELKAQLNSMNEVIEKLSKALSEQQAQNQMLNAQLQNSRNQPNFQQQYQQPFHQPFAPYQNAYAPQGMYGGAPPFYDPNAIRYEAELEKIRKKLEEKEKEKDKDKDNVTDVKPEVVQISDTPTPSSMMYSGAMPPQSFGFVQIAEGLFYSPKDRQTYVMTPLALANSPVAAAPAAPRPAVKKRPAPKRKATARPARRRAPLQRRPLGSRPRRPAR